MALIYHNITPPEYFVGVHRTLARQCFRGRRELQRLRRPLRPGARRLGVQPPGSRGARLSAHGGAAGRSRLLAPRSRSRTGSSPREFDDEWTNIVFVGRVIANKKIEDLIRFFHAYHTIFNPRSRLLLVGAHSGFERYLASLHQLVGRRSARRTCTSSATSRTRSWSPSTRSPTCSCAPASTKASACRSSRRSTSRCRCSPTPPRRCRRRWTAPACCSRTSDPLHVAALIDAIVSNADAAGSRSSTASSPRSTGCGRRTSPARCSASSIGSSPRRAQPAPHVAFDFWRPVRRRRRSSRSSGCIGRRHLQGAAGGRG